MDEAEAILVGKIEESTDEDIEPVRIPEGNESGENDDNTSHPTRISSSSIHIHLIVL